MEPAPDQDLVIIGATGDLARRKLLPAIFDLAATGLLPRQGRIWGMARRDMPRDYFLRIAHDAMAEGSRTEFDDALWQKLAPRLFYAPVTDEGFARLKEAGPTRRLFYLAVPPDAFGDIAAAISRHGLAAEASIVIEKPFGYDLETGRRLNRELHAVFDESQIFRIDHYLGKETVQNLLVFRFANAIFEPIWNRNFIDHVQITAAEEVTVGRRAAFYETAGVLRDMFQNHLMQLMTLTAMEAPARLEADAIRDEKAKVLRAVRPMRPEDVVHDTLRAQYRKYRDEPGVAPDSRTATFGVVKLNIDNWRWQGVPFYLRSGKAMSCRTTQIVIQFRLPPHIMFDAGKPWRPSDANRLVLQIQPAEGIQRHFQTKVPDAGMKLRLTDLSFSFRRKFEGEMPEAYERLLLDAMQGDASLFARSDEVELAWSIIDPIQQAWDSPQFPEILLYEAGGWGPPASTEWMRRQGREWFDVCPVLE